MPSENTRRIAKNTGFLYVRMLLTMGVAFYTSRVVLNALGVEDYGIYNVVGGVVAMFSFLTYFIGPMRRAVYLRKLCVSGVCLIAFMAVYPSISVKRLRM